MRDPRITAALACAVFGCLAVGSAASSYTADVETTNTVSIDTVDIEIVETAEAEPTTLYGDEGVTCASTIENKGAACWVRVRTSAGENGSALVGELASPSAIEAPDTRAAWMEGADGYYYLTSVLDEDAAVAFAETVRHRTDDWDGTGFEAARVVTAEAVQATAFEPDFEAEEPWGDLEPEESIYARTGGTDED